MSYKIIVDSCGELTEEMKASGHFETASLQIDVAGHHIIDDETFDRNVQNHPARRRKDIWKDITVKRIEFTPLLSRRN